LGNVGCFANGYFVVRFVLEDDTDFSTVIVIDDAAANVDVTEGVTAAWLNGASYGGWNGKS